MIQETSVNKTTSGLRPKMVLLSCGFIIRIHIRTEVFVSTRSVGNGHFDNFNLGITKRSVIPENPVFPNPVLPKTYVVKGWEIPSSVYICTT